MKHRVAPFFALLTLALSSVVAVAQAPQIASFSADMKTSGPGGREGGTGKMYVSGETKHMRMEMNMHGHNAIILVDSANQSNPKSTILMPEQHMYMEMSAFGAGPGMRKRGPDVKMYDPENPCAAQEGVTCKKIGTETVNGYECDKWEFSGKEEATVWISQKLRFPIKTVQKDGTTVEFSNIKPGPQDPALFTVPAGFQKMDMGGMMGGKMPQ